MVGYEPLREACAKINAAALIGDGWPDALNALSAAAGARGVMIMHNRDRRLVAHISTDSIREPVDAYMAGKAPPNARQTKVRHDFDPGFRVDHDDFDDRQISRDPYYQDYLRPIGLHWHANARLSMAGTDEIAVSFKREFKLGIYDGADKIMLDHILPSLRASAHIAECIFDAETRGMVRALHQRGRPVLEFDAWGRVRRSHGAFDGVRGPLAMIKRRAVTVQAGAQAGLDKAIELAARPPRRQVPVRLYDAAGNRYLLQLMPVLGRARDVFFATSAIGVLIGQPKRAAFSVDWTIAIDLFGLAPREAQVAGLLCEGCSVGEIAARLRIVPDTVRYHLKSIFDKTGTRRQAELVGLLAVLAT